MSGGTVPVWTRIADLIDSDGQAGLISIVAVDGSAPRDAGAAFMRRVAGMGRALDAGRG